MAQIEFDAGYNSHGYIAVAKTATCMGCGEQKPCLCSNSSEGEYRSAQICADCIALLFADEIPPNGAPDPKFSEGDLVRLNDGEVGRVLAFGDTDGPVWNPLVKEWEYMVSVLGKARDVFESHLTEVPKLS